MNYNNPHTLQPCLEYLNGRLKGLQQVDIQGGYDNGSNTLIVLISLLKRIDDEGYL
jgi:hypothetical protein